jgi:mRNA-degrading endonuclease RelE of RelBE toxin-antitoxin system
MQGRDPGPWRLVVASRARRDLRNLDPPVRARVVDALEQLTADKPTGDLRPLSGRPDEARLRVGDWRVLLKRDSVERTIGRPPLPDISSD